MAALLQQIYRENSLYSDHKLCALGVAQQRRKLTFMMKNKMKKMYCLCKFWKICNSRNSYSSNLDKRQISSKVAWRLKKIFWLKEKQQNNKTSQTSQRLERKS